MSLTRVKFILRRISALDPAVGLYVASPDLQVDWERNTPIFPIFHYTQRLLRLILGACGASPFVPPNIDDRSTLLT